MPRSWWPSSASSWPRLDHELAAADSAEGKWFEVLSLDQLIEVKSFVGRPKDRVVEMELRAIRGRGS
jgi:hypothetical protein